MLRRLLSIAVAFASLTLPAAAARPNVLFIASDDLNDWLGCMGGHPQVKTPHLDALAARGTLFLNAHCQAPVCNPSRTSLLLGLRPSSTGIHGLAPGPRAVPALRDRLSLPQAFRRAGWHTFTCGKIWHDGALGRDRMADEFDVVGPAPPMPLPPQRLSRYPSGMRVMDWGPFPAADDDNADAKIAAAAVNAIRSAPGDKPFFIACGFRLPHVPCFAPQPWFDLYPDSSLAMPPIREDDRADTPPFSWFLHWKLPEPRLRELRKVDEWRPLVRSYLASVSAMDAMAGRVLDALRESGRADDTIVVFWSDHGWHLGEKLITGKNTLWERSTRVPLIMSGPGIARGTRCAQPAELLDIFPTLVDLAGLPPVDGLEGLSLRPQLADPEAPRERPAITTHNQGNHGIRDRSWRYIRYADGSEELYHLANDPHEWTNRAALPEHAEKKRALAAWLPKTDVPAVPGSAHRVLTRIPGTDRWKWEGTEIPPGAPVPGLDD